MRRPRLVFVVTHPVSADVLLRGQLAFMRERGFDVTVVAAPGPLLEKVAARERVEIVAVPMVRRPEPHRDLVALAQLVRVFRRLQPDIVNAGTTKGGLLGMLAARATNVPVRIYLMRGLRLETATGPMRSILGVTERVAAGCAHDVACVSRSLLRAAVDGGYVPRDKALVVGDGASNGVDTARFCASEALRVEGARRLEKLGVAPNDPTVGFVGRLVSDKGVDDALDAFARVRAEIPSAKLVLVGSDLGDEDIDPSLVERVRATPGVVATGHVVDVAPLYTRMDVLAFPSYREGFPNAVAEAAATEVPVVAFRSTGVVDAVVDGQTGALVDQGDRAALGERLIQYLRSPELRRAHGVAARARVERRYENRVVWNAWLDFYGRRLSERGLPMPPSAREGEKGERASVL